jgi:20S proteasome alpha/beta subunit
MTLLVGILCENGAVIAADRQTTHGTSLSGVTVGKSANKISLVSGEMLLACSGYRGLGQQLSGELEGMKNFHAQRRGDVAKKIQEKFRELLRPAFSLMQNAPAGLQNAAQSDVICGSILAAKFQDGVNVAELTWNGSIEFLSPDVPFICLGSGKANADPFLGFLFSVYFSDSRRPTLSEGELLAYWTISLGIELKSQGVGFGVDVFSLDGGNSSSAASKPNVKQLSDGELEEHREFIRSAMTAMKSVKDTIATGDATPPPELKTK